MKFYWIGILLLTVVLFSAGCRATGSNYYNNEYSGALNSRIDLDKFNESARDRTPVILIHGLWGAQLSDTKENSCMWGEFSGFAPTAEKKFKALALNLRKNSAIAPLTAVDILKKTRVNVLGWTFELENYSGIIDLLKAIGYVPEKTLLPANNHYSTLFIYHYDWRKSIDENAAGLAEFIDEKKKYLENQFKSCPKHRNKEVRFDLLGHSMGGLIARYYVEYGLQKLRSRKTSLPERNWYGAKNVRKVIMAGTPNAGYVDTLLELTRGVRFDSFAPICPAGVLATFPSYYQMLPDVSAETVRFKSSSKAVDIFDVALWQKYQWGLLEDNSFNRELLANIYPALPEKERFGKAAEYTAEQLDKASRFKFLISRPIGIPPEPVKYYLFASGGLKTNSLLEVDDVDGTVEVAGFAPGDGKVTFRSSGFEHSQKNNHLVCSDIYMLDGGHMGFMSSTLFACNLALVLHSEL